LFGGTVTEVTTKSSIWFGSLDTESSEDTTELEDTSESLRERYSREYSDGAGPDTTAGALSEVD